KRMTGYPLNPGFWGRCLGLSMRGVMAVAATVAGLGLAGQVHADNTLLNVSYDPTRELYREVNAAFSAKWQAEGHAAPTIETSHGGSGAQARSVIDGLKAQV